MTHNVQTVSFETRHNRPWPTTGLVLLRASQQHVSLKHVDNWVDAFHAKHARFSYTNGRLKTPDNRWQQTVHPAESLGKEWLCQQNPYGAVFLLTATVFSPAEWTACNTTYSTPEAWWHALTLHAMAHTRPTDRFLYHPAVYQTTLAFEQRLYFPADGLAQRVQALYPDYAIEQPPKETLNDKPPILRRPLADQPLVSILIPFKDKPELLRQCLDSILAFEAHYPAFEVIGIDNQSTDPSTFDTLRAYEARSPKIRFISYPQPFNFSAINNEGARHANGTHLLLLNNDIEIITPDWLARLVEWSASPDIGCVGAKLYYPDNRIQHVGCSIVALNSVIHSFKYLDRSACDPWQWVNINRNVSVVTGACLMVKKAVYDQLGGLDAEKFRVSFNDVDFCLRVRDAGYRNLVLGSVEAYHHESVSRGKVIDDRERQEHAFLREKHPDTFTQLDPYFSGALDHFSEPFSRVQKIYMTSPVTKRLMATKVPGTTKRLNIYRLQNQQLYCRITDAALHQVTIK
jgi:GT2 family glycosyltransferase